MNEREKLAKRLDLEIMALVTEAESIDKRKGQIWVRAGQICIKMRNGKLYRELGFSGFSEWTETRLNLHKSQVCLAMGAVEDLSEDVGTEDLAEMTLNNAQVLRQIPARQRKADIIEAAKTQTEREFRETVKAKHPDLKIEQRITLTFHLDESAAGVVKRALAMSEARSGSQGREQALEDLAQNYLADFEESQVAATELASKRIQ